MPNSLARMKLQEAIEAENAKAMRRLMRYEVIAEKYLAIQQPGGIPLSVAELLALHSLKHPQRAVSNSSIDGN